jgi:hypothetical protein
MPDVLIPLSFYSTAWIHAEAPNDVIENSGSPNRKVAITSLHNYQLRSSVQCIGSRYFADSRDMVMFNA